MADKLMFPIGFDLDSAVKNATQDWEKTYAKKLETAIGKKPVAIKLTFDTKLDKLEDVKKRLAQLKIEPITPETESAIQTLTKELQSLAKALEKIQKLNATNASASSPNAVRAARINEINQRTADRTAIANEKARVYAARAEAAELRLAQARQRSINSIKAQNQAYSSQGGYVERLVKRLAIYYSLQQVSSFLTTVREVTAQFELQRVSLGAIIQDQNRANQLFSEIKSFALKSPLKIMDLTTYTKQVAAYRIETDKLFDTTKRLADVSVGLGVDMGRLVLAYGQVKAASYLRAAEIRQFTEAGIPMLELLAEKFTELQGKMVSTEDVMDLVSKRAVSFSMVEEIFNDMTSAGGMFYNMQEKQGNTLFGMWSKLGDAASVMYDEIGNTESVNNAIKRVIELAAELMRNWRSVGTVLASAGIMVAVTLLTKRILALGDASIAAAKKRAAQEKLVQDAVQRRIAAENALTTAQQKGIVTEIARAEAALKTAEANEAAIITAQKGVSVFTRLGAGLVSLGKMLVRGFAIGLVITGVMLLIEKLFNADTAASRLKESLDEVKSSAITESDKSVRKFESLANAAVKAADGSKAQRDALEELKNTYGKLIPLDDLKIEKLRALEGHYEELTQAIRDNIAQQKLQEGINKINDAYGIQVKKTEDSIKKDLKNTEKFTDEALSRIMANIKRLSEESDKGAGDIIRDVLKSEGYNIASSGSEGFLKDVDKLIQKYREQDKAIKDLTNEMSGMFPGMGLFAGYLKQAHKQIENMTITAEKSTFAYNQEVIQKSANIYIRVIRDALIKAKADIKIEDYMKVGTDGTKVIDWEGLKKAIQEGKAELKPELNSFLTTVQKAWDGFAPSSTKVGVLRSKLQAVSSALGVSMDLTQRFLADSGDDVTSYAKKVKEWLDEEKKGLNELNFIKKQQAAGVGTPFKPVSDEDLKNANDTVKVLNSLFKWLSAFMDAKSRGGSYKSDPRLGILQEMVSTLKQVNKEYDELAKKEGATKALTDTQKVYTDTFTNMQSLAKEYNFNLPKFGIPTDTASLIKYLDAIKKAMKKIPKSEKAVLSLQVDTGKLDVDDQQKKIEKQLKELQDRISRAKTAKEFFDKVLNMTGDYEMSADVTMSIYGNMGEGLQKQMADEIRTMFDVGDQPINIPVNVIDENNRINYLELEKFAKAMLDAGKIGEEAYQKISKAAQDGQKDLSKSYEGYLKDLEKAKTYADKRIELARYTANKIAEIEASSYSPEQKEKLIAGYNERETREAAKLEYEAFKDTPLYVQMFEDLEHASTSTLKSMKKRLLSLQSTWGAALDPTQLKEMQSRMAEIDEQLRTRNPFKALKEAYLDYRDTVKDYTIMGAEVNVATAQNAYDAIEDKDSGEGREAKKTLDIEKSRLDIVKQLTNGKGKQLKGQKAINAALEVATNKERNAWKEMVQAEAEYEQAVKEHGAESQEAKDSAVVVDNKKKALTLAQETSKLIQNDSKSSKTLKETLVSAVTTVQNVISSAGDVASSIADMQEALGADEEDVQYWNDIAEGLNKIGGAIDNIMQAAMSGNVSGIVSGVLSFVPNMVAGFSSLFNAGKVRKANKEIKRQERALKELEYAYNRLGVAADKALGADWINNFEEQKKILQQQKAAYLRMAEAEQSKGKDMDKDKYQEYLDAIRDIDDQIADMQGEIFSQLAGSDLVSVAKDFAQAWIEAYKEFGSTTDAISKKYKEMIENMILNSIIARTIQTALQPIFEMIDAASANDLTDPRFWNKIVAAENEFVSAADSGIQLYLNSLKQAGLEISRTASDSDLTGIARDIASASEEDINGLAAGINTQNFYISQIHANVSVITRIIQDGYLSTQDAVGEISLTDLVTLQNQHLANLPQIAANTAATVERCERAAVACEEILVMLGRVVKPRGVQSSYILSTSLN